MAKRVGDIQAVSKTADGEEKPAVQIHNDNYTHHLLYVEALEGFSERVSKIISEQYNKPKRMYFGHGYFKVKPKFVVALNENTSDPMPKRDRNGNMMGVWELKDAFDGTECLLWCYSQPKSSNQWEFLKQQIEYIIFKVNQLGYAEVDEDGYLPVVIRIGKAPTRFGAKYATAVGWTDEDNPVSGAEFLEFDSPITQKIDIPTPRMANQYETSTGPTVLNTSSDY